MEFKVNRTYLGEKYTIGKFFINGEYFCDTLEDKVRDFNKDGDLLDEGETKIYGDTAIPYGRYKVIYTFSPHFGKKLPRLVGVKHFDGILIHAGNTDRDTNGCILVGYNKVKGRVINSTICMKKIIEIMEDCTANKEEVWITIT